MKNLNSKKARQELSDLILSIHTGDIMVDHYAEEMAVSTNQNAWEIQKANFDTARANRNGSIIKLVEVYGIDHVHYEDIIEERAEEEANKNECYYNDYGLDAWDIK